MACDRRALPGDYRKDLCTKAMNDPNLTATRQQCSVEEAVETVQGSYLELGKEDVDPRAGHRGDRIDQKSRWAFPLGYAAAILLVTGYFFIRY